ncbi:phosphoribosylaminoimidazolesuccinocarboxamide synthase [Desulfofalx alkaliphila]|uniref:phosphoribosylaminoimidazolesuccinocarboxamide synthase n=1 Tax=Desulfofalx alkaliphila TaxID=105483 RepID=UPI0004E18E17|nr:phosphoribosylaminoimidazolesuccinocarboxamide synthase [Desulfofalx alkaliphila]
MQKLEMLYEGKAKKVYRTDNPDLLWVEYKDDATAFNGEKKGTIVGKGVLNNLISAHFFQMLAQEGVANHFVELINEREQIVKALDIIQVEVIVRNLAAGSMAKRLGMEEGTDLGGPVVDYCYKSDELGDPLINDDHIRALKLATPEQVQTMRETALKVNQILTEYMKGKNIILVDYKLEFGIHKGQVLLGDEISPDTCRFWDSRTMEKLDKDRFRRDLGQVEDAYKEVYRRLTGKEVNL